MNDGTTSDRDGERSGEGGGIVDGEGDLVALERERA